MANDYDLENLADVWLRVDASSPSEPADGELQDVLTLRRFIDDEESDMRAYLRLAKMACGTPAAAVFIRTAADERRHAKRLMTEHFLLTGDTYAPNVKTPDDEPLLTSVRNRYIGEREGSAAYKKAAEETKTPRLSAIYSELAADERRHAAAMLCLIERLMA